MYNSGPNVDKKPHARDPNPEKEAPQKQQEPPQLAEQKPVDRSSVIYSYIGLLLLLFAYGRSVQNFVIRNISYAYSDVVTISLILLLSWPIYSYRAQLNKYISGASAALLLLAIMAALVAPPSAVRVEKELLKYSVGNDFTDFAASLFSESHRIYSFFGRSGTGKTNIAVKAADLSVTMLKREVHKRVFFLHNQASKSVDDFFNVENPDSLAGWVQPGGAGCSRERCYLILEDLHLLLDYYYLTMKQPELVDQFFNKLEELVSKNRRVVVIMIIEITAFSRSIDHNRIANVSSNAELQKELEHKNSVFNRLGDQYLSVFFKDVHRDYNQWKAAMQVHLDELVRNTLTLSKAQLDPFESNTRIEFDESVFKKSRKLVASFKDVKKFFLPRLYSKLVDDETPRNCTPSKGRILTVYADDDFDVKCESCISCRVLYSEVWTRLFTGVLSVPTEFLFRAMDVLKQLQLLNK